MLRLVAVATVLLSVGEALNCYNDTYLDNLQEYSFKLWHSPADLDYWRSSHFNYITFGEFSDTIDSGTTITGAYYTDDGDLITKTVIDCNAKTWTSYITGEDSGVEEEYQSGDLDNDCEAGEIFDLWFKTEQPQSMWFLWNAQPLYLDTRTVTKGRYPMRYEVTKNAQLNTKYSGYTAAEFKATATGSASFTRFAYGKCFAWPDSVGANCTDAKYWLLDRSKTSARDLGKKGHFIGVYTVNCVDLEGKEQYYKYRQDNVHAGRTNVNYQCCCTYQDTGKVYEDDNDSWCAEDASTCPFMCAETYNSTIYAGSYLQEELEAELELLN